MNLESGELITLENNEEYIVMNNINYNDKNYVLLITSKAPISIKVAIEKIEDNKINLNIVENSKEIEELIKYISK